MATIQIKNVPDEVHEVLVQRAHAAGKSLQQYTLQLLTEDARRQRMADLFARMAPHRVPLDMDQVVADIRADRESR
ncbi:MAG TPA: hypothetical protein VGR21_09060 [Cryptosporangiaceae bacterium]|nr:hypothetical protein [Cryptosporangiaceae bacterium]